MRRLRQHAVAVHGDIAPVGERGARVVLGVVNALGRHQQRTRRKAPASPAHLRHALPGEAQPDFKAVVVMAAVRRVWRVPRDIR